LWEHFAQTATVQLGPYLRCNFHFEPVNFHCRTYRSYLQDFQGSRPSLYFAVDPTVQGCFTIELNLLLSMLERMLGGKGHLPPERNGDYLTEVESHLLTRILEGLLQAYEMAWEPYQAPKPRYAPGYTQFNPYVALLCSPSDTVLVSTFQIRTPFVDSTIDLVIPWETVRRRLAVVPVAPVSTMPGPKLKWQTQQVEVSLYLGKGEVLFSDLLHLEKGDIIKLDTGIRDPLEVRVNGLPKFKAYPGVRGRHLGARVCEVLTESGEEPW
jgi:flagellar motor switch protein FliM